MFKSPILWDGTIQMNKDEQKLVVRKSKMVNLDFILGFDLESMNTLPQLTNTIASRTTVLRYTESISMD